MKRRWISLFLCCALLLGFLPGIIPSAQAAPAVTVSYYGRDQLAGLNNAAALLYAYDQIVAGVESATEKITIYNGTNAISSAELKTVMHAYLRDHAEHFWMGGSYTTTSVYAQFYHDMQILARNFFFRICEISFYKSVLLDLLFFILIAENK